MFRLASIWMAVMLAGCAASYQQSVRELRPIPARWLDDPDAPEPDWADFDFTALSFSTPTDGWIIGNRMILHIVDEGLTVTFIHRTQCWLSSVAFSSPNDGWTAGFRGHDDAKADPLLGTAGGVIWHYSDGRWTASDTSRVDWPHWIVSSVHPSPAGDVWALAGIIFNGDDEHPPAPRRLKKVLLRSDGSGWELDASTRQGDRRWAFNDACFDASGDGWFVGMDFADPSAPLGLAVRRRDGAWERAPLPPVAGQTVATLTKVRCLPGHRAVAIGRSADQPLVLRFDGEWSAMPLPEPFRDAFLSAVAVPSEDDIWLAASWVGRHDREAAFFHWSGGEWTEVSPPPLSGGRRYGYSFADMQFVSPTEGWAVGSDDAGPGLSNGVIFHYKDGVWRHQSWSWHLWDMPWFGLFGD